MRKPRFPTQHQPCAGPQLGGRRPGGGLSRSRTSPLLPVSASRSPAWLARGQGCLPGLRGGFLPCRRRRRRHASQGDEAGGRTDEVKAGAARPSNTNPLVRDASVHQMSRVLGSREGRRREAEKTGPAARGPGDRRSPASSMPLSARPHDADGTSLSLAFAREPFGKARKAVTAAELRQREFVTPRPQFVLGSPGSKAAPASPSGEQAPRGQTDAQQRPRAAPGAERRLCRRPPAGGRDPTETRGGGAVGASGAVAPRLAPLRLDRTAGDPGTAAYLPGPRGAGRSQLLCPEPRPGTRRAPGTTGRHLAHRLQGAGSCPGVRARAPRCRARARPHEHVPRTGSAHALLHRPSRHPQTPRTHGAYRGRSWCRTLDSGAAEKAGRGGVSAPPSTPPPPGAGLPARSPQQVPSPIRPGQRQQAWSIRRVARLPHSCAADCAARPRLPRGPLGPASPRTTQRRRCTHSLRFNVSPRVKAGRNSCFV